MGSWGGCSPAQKAVQGFDAPSQMDAPHTRARSCSSPVSIFTQEDVALLATSCALVAFASHLPALSSSSSPLLASSHLSLLFLPPWASSSVLTPGLVSSPNSNFTGAQTGRRNHPRVGVQGHMTRRSALSGCVGALGKAVVEILALLSPVLMADCLLAGFCQRLCARTLWRRGITGKPPPPPYEQRGLCRCAPPQRSAASNLLGSMWRWGPFAGASGPGG